MKLISNITTKKSEIEREREFNSEFYFFMTERNESVVILVIVTSFDVPGMYQDEFSVIVSSVVCADRAFTVRFLLVFAARILELIALRLRFKIYDQGSRTIFSDIITGFRVREGSRFSRSNISRPSYARNADNERCSRRYAHAIWRNRRMNLKFHGSDDTWERKIMA